MLPDNLPFRRVPPALPAQLSRLDRLAVAVLVDNVDPRGRLLPERSQAAVEVDLYETPAEFGVEKDVAFLEREGVAV